MFFVCQRGASLRLGPYLMMAAAMDDVTNVIHVLRNTELPLYHKIILFERAVMK